MERSQVSIECSMQYKLKLDHLTDIYAAHEMNYHDKMVKVRLSRPLQVADAWLSNSVGGGSRKQPMPSRMSHLTTVRRNSTRSGELLPKKCLLLCPRRSTGRTLF